MGAFDRLDNDVAASLWCPAPATPLAASYSDGAGAFADVPHQISNEPPGMSEARSRSGESIDAIHESSVLDHWADRSLDLRGPEADMLQATDAAQRARWASDTAAKGDQIYNDCIADRRALAEAACQRGTGPLGSTTQSVEDCERDYAKGLSELRSDARIEQRAAETATVDVTLPIPFEGGKIGGVGGKDDLQDIATIGRSRTQVVSERQRGDELECNDARTNYRKQQQAEHTKGHPAGR